MRVVDVVRVAVAAVVAGAIGCGRSPPAPTGGPPRPTTSTSEPSLSGGQSGEDGSGTPCWPTEADGAASDVVNGSGGSFTAQELLAFATGRFTGTLGWSEGGSTPLTIDLAWPGPIRLVDTDCDPERAPDVIVVLGSVVFATSDGALAETGPATLVGAGPGSAALAASWTEGSLHGSYAFPDDGGATSALDLGATSDAAGVRGDLRVSVQFSGGSGAHGTGGASVGEPVATFGAARP